MLASLVTLAGMHPTQVAGLALKQQHSFIDTIGEEDSATNVQASGHRRS